MMTISSDEAYRQAGVDLKSAQTVVDVAKKAAARTRTANLLGGIGGFSGAFEIPEGYRKPVLLCACDGVGTKLKIAFEAGIHHTVGIDLVAMSVNDILVNGGQPLVFLDYLATEKIQPEQLEAILDGIATGCEQSGCALVGGETAEMPGFYARNEYDLAGFCVGVVEKDAAYPHLDDLQAGDMLIGLASNGLHSNGYSLVRKILFQDNQIALDAEVPEPGTKLAETLLAPTRIYVKPVLQLLKAMPEAVKAMVHVTGGGFYDNIPRILKEGLSARIDSTAWQAPPIFGYLQTLGNLTNEAMWHTFNCGVGYMLVVKAEEADAVLAYLRENTEETAFLMGRLTATPGRSEVEIS